MFRSSLSYLPQFRDVNNTKEVLWWYQEYVPFVRVALSQEMFCCDMKVLSISNSCLRISEVIWPKFGGS